VVEETLTTTHEYVNGGLCTDFDYRGHKITVYNSTGTALKVINLFGDTEMDANDKIVELVYMIFPEPEPVIISYSDDLGELLISICWDAYGIDISADKRYSEVSGKPVFDWDEDAGRIQASLLAHYGLKWSDVAKDFTFAQTCDLLHGLLEADSETPFQSAIHYRTAKPPKPTKHNQEECRQFDKLRKHFALGKKSATVEDTAAAVSNMLGAVFASTEVGRSGIKHSND
jgi:hypothetical protein